MSGTGRARLSRPCALGQMPNADRFCHQDREGLDTDQLPLPGDRLRERRRALSKIDGRCQKMISPQPNAGPRRSSNPRQRGLLGRAVRQPARQGALTWPSCFPAPGSPQFPGEKKSRRGPHLGGAVGKQESLAPLVRVGAPAGTPFIHPASNLWEGSLFTYAPLALLVSPSRAGPPWPLQVPRALSNPGSGSGSASVSSRKECSWGGKQRG